jgi:hypothetical protein
VPVTSGRSATPLSFFALSLCLPLSHPACRSPHSARWGSPFIARVDIEEGVGPGGPRDVLDHEREDAPLRTVAKIYVGGRFVSRQQIKFFSHLVQHGVHGGGFLGSSMDSWTARY